MWAFTKVYSIKEVFDIFFLNLFNWHDIKNYNKKEKNPQFFFLNVF